MKPVAVSLVLLGLAALGLAQRTDYGQALGISGVPVAESLQATVSAIRLEGRNLKLEVGSVRLVIEPLPNGLERFPFSGSNVYAERRDHPDGPETRLEFRASDGQVLALGSGTARRSLMVAGWRFDTNIGTSLARVRSPTQSAILRVGRTATLRGADGSWCVRLLALRIPQAAKPGVALEAEGPRFDWMATLAGPSGRCTSP